MPAEATVWDVVCVGGALYVTTKENAVVLQALEDKKSKSDKRTPNAENKPRGATAKPIKEEKTKPASP